MLGDDLQNDLFCLLSREGREADCLVVSWLLLPLFEDGSNTGFSLITGHLSDFSRMMESGLATKYQGDGNRHGPSPGRYCANNSVIQNSYTLA